MAACLTGRGTIAVEAVRTHSHSEPAGGPRSRPMRSAAVSASSSAVSLCLRTHLRSVAGGQRGRTGACHARVLRVCASHSPSQERTRGVAPAAAASAQCSLDSHSTVANTAEAARGAGVGRVREDRPADRAAVATAWEWVRRSAATVVVVGALLLQQLPAFSPAHPAALLLGSGAALAAAADVAEAEAEAAAVVAAKAEVEVEPDATFVEVAQAEAAAVDRVEVAEAEGGLPEEEVVVVAVDDGGSTVISVEQEPPRLVGEEETLAIEEAAAAAQRSAFAASEPTANDASTSAPYASAAAAGGAAAVCTEPNLASSVPGAPCGSSAPASASASSSALASIPFLVQEDRINANVYSYPRTLPGLPSTAAWIQTRAPERYSSAAPLSPDARLRIVSERLLAARSVVISVAVSPPNPTFLLLPLDGNAAPAAEVERFVPRWTPLGVARSVLADRTSPRMSSMQRLQETVIGSAVETARGEDGIRYFEYEYLQSKSPIFLPPAPVEAEVEALEGARTGVFDGKQGVVLGKVGSTAVGEVYRHSLAVTAEREGYLYTLNVSCLDADWPLWEPYMRAVVDSFRLTPTTRDYVPPWKDPWRFW